MNAAQLKALAEWWRMLQGRGQFKDTAAIEMEQRLNRMAQAGHEAAGQPSGMELTQIRDRREALARRRLQELLPERERERTLQGQLEGVEVSTTPSLPVPSTENLLQYRTREGFHTSPYTRYPGTLSSYSIPQRGIEPPDIHVDPSGQARIVSDYYDSIVNYRKSKTGEVAKYMESFDPVEQARRLSQVEQLVPEKEAGGFIPEPGYVQGSEMQKRFSGVQISTPHTKDTLTAQRIEGQTAYDKRMARLRAAQAGKTSKFDELIKRYQRAASKRLREMNRRSRGGMPFNPKLLESQGKFLPTGNPIQRALQRRLR